MTTNSIKMIINTLNDDDRGHRLIVTQAAHRKWVAKITHRSNPSAAVYAFDGESRFEVAASDRDGAVNKLSAVCEAIIKAALATRL